jgi:hypothetical protein
MITHGGRQANRPFTTRNSHSDSGRM